MPFNSLNGSADGRYAKENRGCCICATQQAIPLQFMLEACRYVCSTDCLPSAEKMFQVIDLDFFDLSGRNDVVDIVIPGPAYKS